MDDMTEWLPEGRFSEDEIAEGMIEGRICLNCGGPISQNATGRPKRFCCEECRRSFCEEHPAPERWQSYERIMCPICGRRFFGKKVHRRKYCSKACSNRGRRLRQ